MENILYIIDGHGLIYRAYYAFIRNPLITIKGENTSAIFGFMRMILRLISDHNPQYLVCVFDTKEKTFRHKIYSEYKAKRLKAPEDLTIQAETIKNLVESLGIKGLEMDGYEADDIIGTLVERACEKKFKSVIVTSDKDILQLVDESVSVYANKKGISEVDIMDRDRVYEVWRVWPENMTDLLALMGDQSDNIPGVRGIGKTTALNLIQEFGNIEYLYENLDKIEKEKTRNLLIQGKNDALLSKKLVTIKHDVPIDFNLQDFTIKSFPKKEGITLLTEKELHSIAGEL